MGCPYCEGVRNHCDGYGNVVEIYRKCIEQLLIFWCLICPKWKRLLSLFENLLSRLEALLFSHCETKICGIVLIRRQNVLVSKYSLGAPHNLQFERGLVGISRRPRMSRVNCICHAEWISLWLLNVSMVGNTKVSRSRIFVGIPGFWCL